MIYILGILLMVSLIFHIRKEKYNKKMKDRIITLEKNYCFVLAKNMDLENDIKNLNYRYSTEKEKDDEIKRLHKSARSLKHDMKNHIIAISSYINNKEFGLAKDYISEIMDKLNNMYTYIETGNSLLSYIVNTKLEAAKNQKIDVKAEIQNIEFSKMSSIDFSSLLNNLLDNAIEASKNVKDKKIELKILRTKGYNTILIKNKIDESVLKTNPDLKSTKKNKEEHGYGISEVKSIIKKYDGMIDIYEEENYFCIYVVYPY